jgi:hypothetical protein
MEQHITTQNAHLLLEEFYNDNTLDERVSATGSYLESDCDHNIVDADGFDCCIKCGEVTDNAKFVIEQQCFEYYKRRATYKRRLYCIEKLRLMSCQKFCIYRRKEYLKMLKDMKKCKFNTINKLRRLMNTRGYTQFYKYIYLIFRELKGVQLITLTQQQIHIIAVKFVDVDVKFREFLHIHHERKNIMSYNSIIYCVMKELKIQGYKTMVLPLNHKSMQQLHTLLMES